MNAVVVRQLNMLIRVDGYMADHPLVPAITLATTRTYAELMNRGNAFVEAIGPVKAAFVEHGLPVDFDEQLAELLAQFAAAGVRTNGGLHKQMDGTAGMAEAARKGVKAVRVLDSIMREKLKDSPAELSVWIKVQQIKSGPITEEEQPTTLVAGVTPASAKSTALAASNGGEVEQQQPAGVEPRVNGTSGGVLVA